MARWWMGLGVIFVLLLLVDWTAGVLVTHGQLPTWVYFVLNIPFGIVYVWTRSLWTGARYELMGQPIAGMWISLAQILAVVAQAVVYSGVWRWWRQRHRRGGGK